MHLELSQRLLAKLYTNKKRVQLDKICPLKTKRLIAQLYTYFSRSIHDILTHHDAYSSDVSCSFNKLLLRRLVLILDGYAYYAGFYNTDYKKSMQSSSTYFELLKISRAIK